ncbi:hypothetical protein EYF80_011258 [Liparis tanakae]|uniref:Uncharacterized protein n=1 Tax=Liparis tanakae TaxID=230148 RepID=A0A4Z2IKY5_9TELE|nr:hypothetical protein EYF80_011258 [Liparis tanakae]
MEDINSPGELGVVLRGFDSQQPQKVPTNLRGRLTLPSMCRSAAHTAHLRDNKSSGTRKDKRRENERDP